VLLLLLGSSVVQTTWISITACESLVGWKFFEPSTESGLVELAIYPWLSNARRAASQAGSAFAANLCV
jgi:hypothetical protein